MSRWNEYVKGTKTKGDERAIQLLECCDGALRRTLQRNSGGVVISELPEADIIAAIKALAVRIEAPTVARDCLHNMSQDREESVRAFGARLRGQAATCQYTKLCTCGLTVDYTEENVADALITGLSDPNIKQGILGEPNQPLSMDRAITYVESKEVARSSVFKLNAPGSVDAVGSKYKKQTSRKQPKDYSSDSEEKDVCYFCGKPGHGRYPLSHRGNQNAKHSARNARSVVKTTTRRRYVKVSMHPLMYRKMQYFTKCVISLPTGQREVAPYTTMFLTT